MENKQENKPDNNLEPKKGSHRKGILIAAGIVAAISLLILGAGIGAYLYYQPYEKAVLEVGSDMIAPDRLLKHGQTGSFFVGPSYVDTGRVNRNVLRLKNGLFTYNVIIDVVDTVAPEVVPKEQVEFYQGQVPDPKDFLLEIKDMTETMVFFAEDFDFSQWGYREVELVVKDQGSNETRVKVKAHILDSNVVTYLERELNQPATLEDLFLDLEQAGEYSIEPALEEVDYGTYGHKNVKMNMHEDIYDIDIYVCDRVPPTATVADRFDWWVGAALDAEKLVSDIQDETEVAVSYKAEPDWSKLGEVPVTVVLCDTFDNRSEYACTLVLAEDHEPPVIKINGKLHLQIGESFNYYSGVVAMDNKDGEIKPEVDKSQVNEGEEGTYTVTYTAKDSSGNVSAETRDVVVSKQKSTEQKLAEAVQGVLDRIISPGMSQREKARAIYDWTHENIAFIDHTQERDWQKGAINGISQRQGDCFTYYAVSKALLTAVGIDNLDITRSKKSVRTTPHYWNLVNLGDGWYHFDACRVRANPPLQGFMFTDTYARQFSENQVKGYFTYDEENYPDIVD